MILRGIAAFIGFFALLNVLGQLLFPPFDASIWMVDLRRLPRGTALPLYGLAGGLLLAWSVRPSASRWRRWATAAAAFALAAVAVMDAIGFYMLLRRGDIRSRLGVPLSLPLAIIFLVLMLWVLRRHAAASSTRRGKLIASAAFAACGVLLPLAQMLFVGTTDYRRPADAIVVFGARSYRDGTPSLALADRVRTACQLYHEGRAPHIIMSGGPSDGAIDEPEAMRRMAIRLGVPDHAIHLDHAGLNTEATAQNAGALLDPLGASRVLAVSHGYHLPRVKLAFARTGREVYTVPAHETRTLRAMPKLVAREVAALWAYYLLAGGD